MRHQGQVILSTVLLLHCIASAVQATAADPGNDSMGPRCAAKTINFITHTLPQQCIKSTWASPASEQPPDRTDPLADESRHGEPHPPESTTTDAESPRRQQDKPILSFEEWKELMLRRHGQDPADIQERQGSESPSRATEPTDPGISDTFGEEGEISLNLDVAAVPTPEFTGAHAPATGESEGLLGADGTAQYSRSKDAGKTCKERFSYSSFDAGATVLKASPGTKNPKAILVENKDSYMLFECTAEEKYVIVELSDDILVDTVVLANFEFFSSMVRHFRVSVSDRYPVKLDKWRQLGIFEGKNARDIQPFLVENPQIWAKYVRIDFLTYYGNEYYCPLSLLRVHGTRMLESWKETETNPEDDDPVHESVSKGYLEAATHEDSIDILGPQGDVSAVHDAFFLLGIVHATCPLVSPVVERSDAAPPKADYMAASTTDGSGEPRGTTVASQHSGIEETGPPASSYTQTDANATVSTTSSTMPTVSSSESPRKRNDGPVDPPTETVHASSSASEPLVQSKSTDPVSTQSRNRTTTSSAQATLPTVQESFFKTVSKRLQLLESNMTWSLKYVEDQSRYIREALLHIEDRRLSEAEALLAALNHTVHMELGALRQQYGEVWQSTVLALETQREQSQAELIALSSRLNVLADEVVFQKRMSIGQSTLLLCCLVLIIFSRSVTYTIPLVNWQSASGNTFTGGPRASQGIPRVTAHAPSAGNTGSLQPPPSPQNDRFDHHCAVKASTDSGQPCHGTHDLNTVNRAEACDAYGTPEEEVTEQVNQQFPSLLFHPRRDGPEGHIAELDDVRGVRDERKPLPPLPE